MDEETLARLWDWYYQTQAPEALELLTANYQPLAKYLARRALAKAPPHQDREDILSYAHHGLLDAIKKYEPNRGIKFESYASRRIAGEIIDGQRKDDPLTRPMRKRVSALRDAKARFWNDHGRDASDGELADILGETLVAVRELALNQLTLNKELDEHVEQGMVTHDSTSQVVLDDQEADIIKGLAGLLPRLDERDRMFLVLYYMEGRSLKDVGKVLGVSDSRCAQIRKDIWVALL